VDQAGWHQSKKLVIPANITLMPLPAKSLFEWACVPDPYLIPQ
jgi:hypothetical protein